MKYELALRGINRLWTNCFKFMLGFLKSNWTSPFGIIFSFPDVSCYSDAINLFFIESNIGIQVISSSD